jgi:hypothetical protein
MLLRAGVRAGVCRRRGISLNGARARARAQRRMHSLEGERAQLERHRAQLRELLQSVDIEAMEQLLALTGATAPLSRALRKCGACATPCCHCRAQEKCFVCCLLLFAQLRVTSRGACGRVLPYCAAAGSARSCAATATSGWPPPTPR